MKHILLPLILLVALLMVVPTRAQSNDEPTPNPETPPEPADAPTDYPDAAQWVEPLWLASRGEEGTYQPPQDAFGQDAAAAAALLDDWSNAAALACITPLGIANNVAFGAGLVAPPPTDFPYAVAEHAANLALKFCAPAVYPPGDFSRQYDKDDSGRCGYTFNQPRWQGEYKNFMGITLPFGDIFPGKSWGDFGQPAVVHWNSDVDVSLRAPQAIAQQGTDYRLPLGVHSLVWRGETKVSLSDFIFKYIPGGAKLRFYRARKLVFTTSSTAADNVLTLLEGTAPYNGVSWPTMFNEETQRVAVTDSQRPSLSGPGRAAVEAIEPGGISRSTLLYQLGRTLSISDNCDASPELVAVNELSLPAFVPVGESYTVEWIAEDTGPRDLSGAANRSSSFFQTFTVRDTLPPVIVPPPDVVVESTNLPALVTLGHPGTFDLADLNPSVTNNACSLSGVSCTGGVTRFPAGKTTVTWTAVDRAGNRSSTSQYVNVKPIGSNRVPAARKASAAAISYEPVTLTLEASDPDQDRLWFEIDDQPDNGFFHAPLYPYFIQDYRLANVAKIDFSEYCGNPDNYGKYVPTNWPVEAEVMAVADDGTAYVYDRGDVRCLSFEAGTQVDYRVAIFRPDGTWDQANSDRYLTDLQVDWDDERLYSAQHHDGDGSAHIEVFDLDLNFLVRYSTDQGSTPFRNPENVAIDFERSLLYVTDGRRTSGLPGATKLWVMKLPPTPGDYEANEALRAEFLAAYSGPSPAGWQDLALDSAGNLYASERTTNRIYKWSAPVVGPGNSFSPGELIGWMGRCDSGPGCDSANGRSFGYSCSADRCSVSATSGNRPGQFDRPQGIALDNNDILYVTDYGNRRVQRFTPEGFFAGQAVSECDGSCFVLGDFGSPQQVSVNSSNFYVLDDNNDLLHVFKTSPLTRTEDNKAQIVYQSDNNFVGKDTFSFIVTDGLAQSKPATVTISVDRNQRPPVAVGPLSVTTREDNRVLLPVDGYDPDEPLDTISFKVWNGPQNGRFLREDTRYYYVPDPDFEGSDSFTYVASDGKLNSNPQPVDVTVTPVNDPPRFTEDEAGTLAGFALPTAGDFFSPGRLRAFGTDSDPLRVGRGFNTLFTAAFADPDRNDRHTVAVNWGDGSPTMKEGKLLEDGTMTGPVLSEGETGGGGSVTAEHVFARSGDFTVEICVSDNVQVDSAGNKSLTPASVTTCTTLPVRVSAMVDLLVDIQPSSDPYAIGDPFGYDLLVSNHAPESGDGITASGIEVIDTLDPRLKASKVQSEGGRCAVEGIVVRCTLDPLQPGDSTVIHIEVDVPGSLEPGMVLANRAVYRLNQEIPDGAGENGNLVSVVAAADFVVNTIADDPDASPGDGRCAAADGKCSLRAAVEEANAHPAANTVSLADWEFVLEQELEVRSDLAIRGLGAGRTMIIGSGESRLINIAGGSLTLDRLGLQSGTTVGNGGAIFNSGTLVLTAVQISGNHADGSGGALWNEGDLTIERSSIGGNDADRGAGGIANSGTVRLQTVTVSGNRGTVGGIDNAGQAILKDVTVSSNHATNSGGGVVNAGKLSLRNTILGDNTAATSGPDCSGSFTSEGYNLLGKTSGCTVTAQKSSDIVGRSPLLGIQDLNGGETVSQSPLGGSPAIDSGACDQEADQRGLVRPVDGNLDGKLACDIGAVEFDLLQLRLPLVLR